MPASCRPLARERHKETLTEAMEEYVEGIYRLQSELEIVGISDIARYMDVAPASVTTMTKKLVEMAFAEHMPYQGVRLTAAGMLQAQSLLRRHRLLECLLVNFLELPWDDVHELACKLEHYIGDEVANRLEEALGKPVTCPHGNPIDATVHTSFLRLSDCKPGQHLQISCIPDERAELLGILWQAGLLPQTRITLLQHCVEENSLLLDVEGKNTHVLLPMEAASAVRVHSADTIITPRNILENTTSENEAEALPPLHADTKLEAFTL